MLMRSRELRKSTSFRLQRVSGIEEDSSYLSTRSAWDHFTPKNYVASARPSAIRDSCFNSPSLLYLPLGVWLFFTHRRRRTRDFAFLSPQALAVHEGAYHHPSESEQLVLSTTQSDGLVKRSAVFPLLLVKPARSPTRPKNFEPNNFSDFEKR